MKRKCTIDLLNEISYKLRGGGFSSRINERIRNTIKEELEKELANLEAEKAVKEREMEML
jgi:cell division protein FtsB